MMTIIVMSPSRFTRRALSLAVVPALALGGLSGCTATGHHAKPQVVTSFYPLQFVAERIAGQHAEVTDLTKPGVEPHDLELSPRQTATLAGADVVLHEQGLQPAVDEAVSNEKPAHVVDAAKVGGLVDSTTGPGQDPHFWLDPTRLAKVAQSFTQAISAADPGHAVDYRAANAQLQSDLRSLDQEFRTGLAHCRSRTIVVSHDAFEYLGRRYDLSVLPIAGVSPGAEPSPRRLQELADLIRREKITTVFSERLGSSKIADTLASDLGIGTAVLDPVEGLTSSDSTEDYLSLMRQNLAAIAQAGGCS